MKILYYSMAYGGATTTFIRSELNYFASKYSICYLCQKIQNNELIPDYVKIIPFKQNRVIKKIKWWLWRMDILCNHYSAAYSREIKKLIDEFNPDVIHCHFAYEGLMLFDNIDYKERKIIFHFHGYDATQMTIKRSYVRRLRKALRLSNVFAISVNKYFIEKLASRTGISAHKFNLLYCGIDLNVYDPGVANAREKSHDIFLQVSSLSEKKGHEYTLRAFSLFLKAHPQISAKIVFAGDGPRKQYLKQLAFSLGIGERVEFVGSVSPSRAVQLMKEASVFVHHSVTAGNGDMEGIPNALIEAMAMQLPVVSTWHSGIPELVEHEVNGYLVEERDVQALADCLYLALRRGLLPHNREKLRLDFNISIHNAKLESYYQHIRELNSNNI